MESNDVLRVIADSLEQLSFQVERTKEKMNKLPRPVFFGDEGTYLRKYEIDAFEQVNGIALEVEAGRATMGNAIYRDLIQASLMVDARFLALAVPVEYRYGKRSQRSRAMPRRTPSSRRSTEVSGSSSHSRGCCSSATDAGAIGPRPVQRRFFN